MILSKTNLRHQSKNIHASIHHKNKIKSYSPLLNKFNSMESYSYIKTTMCSDTICWKLNRSEMILGQIKSVFSIKSVLPRPFLLNYNFSKWSWINIVWILIMMVCMYYVIILLQVVPFEPIRHSTVMLYRVYNTVWILNTKMSSYMIVNECDCI